MPYALSDNGLKAILEALRVLVIIVPIMWQSSNQHSDRMRMEEKAIHENNERLDKVAAEVKAAARPLVYGKDK
jgi:hypothetical protein